MKKNNFTKSLMLHIRYPWTAACLLILWVGLAIMCAVMQFALDDLILLISCAGVATLIIALIGFNS